MSKAEKRPKFFSFNECREYARRCGVRSFQEWIAFKQRDPRAPSNPQRSYKSEWRGWTDFLGGSRRQRPSNTIWAPYNEVKSYARKLGCRSVAEWMALSKSLPPNIPTSPAHVYEGEFTGWSDFLGYVNRWMSYDEFVSYVRTSLKIESHTVWKKLGRNDLDPRAPSHPDRVYKQNGWNGWPKLFGTKRHSTSALHPGKSFEDRFPELAADWHPTKNGSLKPAQIPPRSSTQVWWMCQVDPRHEWSASAKTRSNGAGACPHCKSRRSVENSLAEKFPAIAAELHPDFLVPATAIASSSNTKVRWRCAQVASHEWDMAPAARTRLRQGCPYCAGRRVTAASNLAAMHPNVAAEWHPTKNEKSPADVLPGSHAVVWWLCAAGHESRGAIRLIVELVVWSTSSRTQLGSLRTKKSRSVLFRATSSGVAPIRGDETQPT